MFLIPLQPVPSQNLGVMLDGQPCQINVYLLRSDVYLDLSLSNVPLLYAQRCLDRVKLVRFAYLGFSGDLCFMDTQGTSNPQYTGLGARYQLVYLEPADLAAGL